MFVNSVIIEQIEYDGGLKTVQLTPNSTGRLVISFPDEYCDKRDAPFYFQDRQHSRTFRKLLKTNGVRKLGDQCFKYIEAKYSLSLPWRGIPTKRGELSYYALSLPEHAVPIEVMVINPHKNEHMKKTVIKDRQKKRYVIYIECRSDFGIFSFDLNCVFVKARRQEFEDSQYSDAHLIEDVYAHYDSWQSLVTEKEKEQVSIYMEGNNVEIYNVQQAAAVGRNAQANNTQMTQSNNSQEENDRENLLDSLVKLREEMLRQASSLDETLEVAKVAEAEKAIKDGNLSKGKVILSTVGKWTYDIATKLGVAIVVEMLKNK
jgi:hypothetical protein